MPHPKDTAFPSAQNDLIQPTLKQWLYEGMPVKSPVGFNDTGVFKLSITTSVQFTGETKPTADSVGRWEFWDESGSFEKLCSGKFKDCVKAATADHKRLMGSSFSHSLKVRGVR